MTASKVKRSLIRSFLNTGTPGSPTWSLIGDGVTSAKIAYNPKTTEETYITQDSASISIDSYAPNMPVEASAKYGDAAFDWVDLLRIARGVLATAETEVVNVWLYRTPTGLGYYGAEKQACSIQIDDFGGEGGVATKINFTINYLGDPVLGTFSPGDLEFVPDPILTKLATMVASGLTFVPVFNKGWLWYACATSNSSANMSSTVETVGATIIQKYNSTVVGQGGAATLAMGLTTLTYEVTNGAEVSTYTVEVTRT
jgi:hypothetical protein